MFFPLSKDPKIVELIDKIRKKVPNFERAFNAKILSEAGISKTDSKFSQEEWQALIHEVCKIWYNFAFEKSGTPFYVLYYNDEKVKEFIIEWYALGCIYERCKAKNKRQKISYGFIRCVGNIYEQKKGEDALVKLKQLGIKRAEEILAPARKAHFYAINLLAKIRQQELEKDNINILISCYKNCYGSLKYHNDYLLHSEFNFSYVYQMGAMLVCDDKFTEFTYEFRKTAAIDPYKLTADELVWRQNKDSALYQQPQDIDLHVIASVLQNNTTLKKINIYTNDECHVDAMAKVTNKGFYAFAQAFRCNNTLTSFIFRLVSVDIDVFKEFADVLLNNTTLTQFIINYPLISKGSIYEKLIDLYCERNKLLNSNELFKQQSELYSFVTKCRDYAHVLIRENDSSLVGHVKYLYAFALEYAQLLYEQGYKGADDLLRRYQQECQDIESILLAFQAKETLKKIQNIYQQAQQFFASKDYPNARKACENIITLDDKYTAAYFLRAQVNEAIGQFSAALADYRHVISLRPEYEEAKQKSERLIKEVVPQAVSINIGKKAIQYAIKGFSIAENNSYLMPLASSNDIVINKEHEELLIQVISARLKFKNVDLLAIDDVQYHYLLQHLAIRFKNFFILVESSGTTFKLFGSKSVRQIVINRNIKNLLSNSLLHKLIDDAIDKAMQKILPDVDMLPSSLFPKPSAPFFSTNPSYVSSVKSSRRGSWEDKAYENASAPPFSRPISNVPSTTISRSNSTTDFFSMASAPPISNTQSLANSPVVSKRNSLSDEQYYAAIEELQHQLDKYSLVRK